MRSGRIGFLPVRVDAYDGYRAAERPMAFTLDGVRYEVEAVLDRWYEGGLKPTDQKIDYFKVRTRQGEVFLLRYLSLFDAWSVRVMPGSA